MTQVTPSVHAPGKLLAVIAGMTLFLAAAPGAEAVTPEEFEQLFRQSQPAPMPRLDGAPRRGGAPPTSGRGGTGDKSENADPGTRGTRSFSGRTCKRKRRSRICITYKRGAIVKRCVRRGRKRTCTFFSKGRATKRCTTKRARTRCKRLRARRTGASRPGPKNAFASVLTWQGWPGNAIPQVGKLLMPGAGSCSATVISRTLVLTAGHCLWQDGGYVPRVVFAPAMTWNDTSDPGSIATPYGAWEAYRWWVPQGYANGDPSLDWGLVEFAPQPGFIGDTTGWWNATWNIGWNDGARVQAAGYPSSGFWKTSEGYNGRGQYLCDSRWDDGYSVIGSGYELWLDCTMNRGASGGPWFVQLSDGSWTVGGMNNRCKSPWDTAEAWCDPYSSYMRSSYLDSRFGAFWGDIQGRRTW